MTATPFPICQLAQQPYRGGRDDDEEELRLLLRYIGVVFEEEIDRLGYRITTLGCVPESTFTSVAERCGFEGYLPGQGQQDTLLDRAFLTLDLYCALWREDRTTIENLNDAESAAALASMSSHMEQYVAQGQRLLSRRGF